MKQFLTTTLFCCLSLALMAQPPVNDDCDGIIDLGVAPYCPDITIPGNESEIYDNVDATASDIGFGNNPDCFNGGGVDEDVWFSFTTSDTIFDYTITLTGVEGPDGTPSIINPQMALYRGDCEFDGLAELLCASAELGETTLELDAEGLTPNVMYFIRINDYSSTATLNPGAFVLCVDQQEPVNMIDEGGSTSCTGELYDSGGPDGDYQNDENFTYTICPSQPNLCIEFSLQYYSIEFSDFGVLDQLLFYDGDEAVPGNLIASIGGSDFNTEISNGGGVCQLIRASSGCMTVQFISDGTGTFEGFAGSWQCFSQACDPIMPITVDPNVTDLDIVDALASPQTQLTITDIICDEGSYGVFEAGDDTDLGLEKGLLLTSGDLFYALGPNTGGGGGNPNANRGQPGDEDLDILSTLYGDGDLSQDACILELDVLASTDELTFEYIFGSEEYPEFVNQFNDIFAFLVSGPGIVGDPAIGGQLNIATLPNDDNTFVEINSVNNGLNWEYYRSNELGQSVEYDGLTSDYLGVKKSLTATAEVIPCSTYHLKLAIADRGDGAWDSGVFISEIRGGTPDINIVFNSGVDYLIEDCTEEPDELVIRLNSAVDEEISYNVNIGGTAELGVDYTLSIPDVITFQPGEIEFSYPIEVLSDFNNAEGVEVIEISLTNDFGCGEVTYTTLTVELHDELNVLINAGQDTTRLCVGGTVGLEADGGAQYFWTPVPIFDNPSSAAPNATPTESGWVNVVGQILDCVDTDSVYLEIIDPQVNILTFDSINICRGDEIQMSAVNNVGGQGLTWTPTAGVGDVNEVTTTFAPEVSTTYFATIAIAGCIIRDSIDIDVDFLNVPTLNADTTICQNYSVQLGSLIDADTTTTTYVWTPDGSLNDGTIPDPIATPDVTTTYELIATTDNGACADTMSVTVTAIPADVNIATLPVDTLFICLGETVDLTAVTSTGGTDGFTWFPDDGSLSTTSELNTIATPTETTQYLTTLTIGACTVVDSLTIYVDSLPVNMELTADPYKDVYCPGELVLITSPIFEPSHFSGIEHQWVSIGEETGDSLYNLVLTTADTFTYIRTTTLGACTDVQEITLNVITPDDLAISPENPDICDGESVDLSLVSGNALEEIEWSPTTGITGCTDCENTTAAPSATTQYMVTAEVEGCPVAASTTVTVNFLPDIGVIGDQTTCFIDGETFSLNNDAAEPGTTYSWTATPGDPTLVPDAAQPQVTPTSTTTYQLVATNDCGDSAGETMITIVPQPTLTVGDNISTCIGTEVTVSSSVDLVGNPETFTWIYDGEIVGNGTSATFPANSTGYAVINYTYGPGANGCETLQDSVMVEALDIAFNVTIDVTPVGLTEVYQGGDFTLTAVIESMTNYDYSYMWSGPGTIISPTEAITDVTAPLDISGLEEYMVTVSIPEGCVEVATIDLDILEPEYAIPNVFSPNGDDINNKFGLFAAAGIENYDCKVFNRWGQLVYESTNVNEFWDGTYNNEPAPSEVYIYLMNFTVGGVTFEEKGDVTLVR